MIRSISTVAVLSLALALTGCAAQQAEREKLASERSQLQSQYNAEAEANKTNTAKIAELEQKLAVANTDLSNLRTQLEKSTADSASLKETSETRAVTLQGKLDETNAKLRAAEELNKTNSAALNDARAKLINAQEQLSAVNTTSKAQTEQVASMTKQIESLNKEIETLRTKLATAVQTAAPTTRP